MSMKPKHITQSLDRLLATRVGSTGRYLITDFESQDKIVAGSFVERRPFRNFLMKAKKDRWLNVVPYTTSHGVKTIKGFCNVNFQQFVEMCKDNNIEVVIR